MKRKHKKNDETGKRKRETISKKKKKKYRKKHDENKQRRKTRVAQYDGTVDCTPQHITQGNIKLPWVKSGLITEEALRRLIGTYCYYVNKGRKAHNKLNLFTRLRKLTWQYEPGKQVGSLRGGEKERRGIIRYISFTPKGDPVIFVSWEDDKRGGYSLQNIRIL